MLQFKARIIVYISLVIMLSMVLVSMTSCGDGEIKIGVYGPFSGISENMGNSMRNGVVLAVKEINDKGGILDKKIKLIERNDESSAEKGAKVMQNLIYDEKVVAVLGPVNTDVAQASYVFPMKAHVPMIINVSVGALVNELFDTYKDNNYVFRVAAADNIQAEMVVAEAIEKRGFKKVAMLTDNTGYGRSGKSKMEAALSKRGVSSVYASEFIKEEPDMTQYIKQLKSSNAEVVLVWGIGKDLARIANDMQKLDCRVPMIGSWTLSMTNFIDATQENGNGITMPQTFIENGVVSEKAKKFVDNYRERYGVENISSAVSAAQGYDSMYLLAEAIKQAGSTNGVEIKKALESLQKPYEGVITTFTTPFSATDHEAIKKEHVRMGVIYNRQVKP